MAEKKYESDMTRKEKRQQEWNNIKNMTWKQRAIHIWEYYKLHMLALVGIIFICVIIGQVLHNSKFETVLQVAILNSAGGDAQGMETDFKKYLKDDDPYHKIRVDSSMYFTEENISADYAANMKLTAITASHELDILIAHKEQYDKFADLEIMFPIEEVLTPEQLETYKDDLVPYGIRVTDSETLKKFDLQSGEEAYLMVLGYSEHLDKVNKFIEYLCEGENS